MAPAPGPVRLVIELMSDGRLSVSGPIQDRLLCYGLLAEARDVIRRQGDAPRVHTVEGPAGAPIREALLGRS